jgi:hypothetical protein
MSTPSSAGAHRASTYELWVDAGARSLAIALNPAVMAQPGRAASKRVDMAVALADIAARTAANAGGLEMFLAGSPRGSREAALVRELVESVTPQPAGLIALRTQPVRLTLDVGTALKAMTEQFKKEFAAVQRTVEEATSEVDAEAARELAAVMDRLYQADKEQWREELTRATRKILTTWGLPASVPVDVVDVGSSGDVVFDALMDDAFEEATGRNKWPPTSHLEPDAWTASPLSYAARGRSEMARSGHSPSDDKDRA